VTAFGLSTEACIEISEAGLIKVVLIQGSVTVIVNVVVANIEGLETTAPVKVTV
jgi:hypothetical protein